MSDYRKNINIPQQPPMRLIDSVLEINAESVSCRMDVRADNIFYNSVINGIYAWVGIELMAQTVGVFAAAQNPGREPQIGFLTSVRKFVATRPHFALGEALTIIAHKEYLTAEFGVFQCEILVNKKLAASATLNVFQPENKNA